MIEPDSIDIDELIGALIEGKIPAEQRADWLAFIGSDSRYSEILALAEATLSAENAEKPTESTSDEIDAFKAHLSLLIQKQCHPPSEPPEPLTLSLGLYYARAPLNAWRLNHAAESRIAQPILTPYGGMLEHQDLSPFPPVMMAYFNDRIECRFLEISPVYVDFKNPYTTHIHDTRPHQRLRLYLPDPLKQANDYRLLRMDLLEQAQSSYRMQLLLGV